MNKLIVAVVAVILALVATLAVIFAKSTPTSKPLSSELDANESFGLSRDGNRRMEPTVFRASKHALSSPVVASVTFDAGVAERTRAHTNEEEDEEMAMSDNSSRQRVWRFAFASERRDAEWTKRMEQELRRQATELLDNRKLVIQNLSCRETICRMYLQFEDQLDADAFKTARYDTNLKYEFQSLDPNFDGEGFDRSNHTYEVMVQRPRPEGLPASAPKEPPGDEENVVHAGDDEGIVVTANGG